MNDAMEVPTSIDLGDGTQPIVMVDDEEIDYMLARRFHKRSGLVNPFVHFPDGSAFIAHLDAVKNDALLWPAAVLMDVNMPRMNGFEVIEAIRLDDLFRDLPVVMMLTSSDDPRDRERALAVGAVGYLLKPYNPKCYLALFASLAAT